MEGTIGEIRMFAGNFAPRTWAFCANQILPIAQNTALFSILGTTYGGNGQNTFALPDFRGRVAVGTGQGPGLTNITLGELAGSTTTTLTINNLPAHNHPITGNVTPQAASDGTLVNDASNKYIGPGTFFASNDPINMAPIPATGLQTAVVGGSQPFSLMQPYLGMNYIICLFGIFPSRD